jgi:gamma-glutamyltranspeptidase/glutathione hydrolase
MLVPKPLVAGAIVLWITASALPLPAQESAVAPRAGPTAISTRDMVVSVSRPASEIGSQVLNQGGNAVDAAVATAFGLAVAWPEAGNIGGGGFMLIVRAGEEPVFIDYRETAPAAATREMFADGKPPSQYKLVGVPGTVRGLALAHEKFGRLPWDKLIAPAIALAEHGVIVNDALAGSLNGALAKSPDFPELRRVYAPPEGRDKWQAGDKLVQPQLAVTLRLIAIEGPDAFYLGRIAEQIVVEMQRGGGLITKEDLAGYQPLERRPIHGTYRGYDIYAPSPPSSGGICLVEMLNIVEGFDLRKHPRWSSRTVHVMTEAMKRAYADRARYLGDSDFVRIPPQLTTKEYASDLAKTISLAKTTPSEQLAPEIKLAKESEQTTHFSVIDRGGMAVSNTYTLEQSFGAKIVVRGAGFLLNNEMGDFNPQPGITTRDGQIGTAANEVRPKKRMLSSMCPTIVCRDGEPVLVTGSPGGRTIINTVFNVLVNRLEYEQPLEEAVDGLRHHHQWFPDRISLEGSRIKRHPNLVRELEALGHTVTTRYARQGDAHSIARDPRTKRLEGVADPRIDGWAVGN